MMRCQKWNKGQYSTLPVTASMGIIGLKRKQATVAAFLQNKI